MTRGKTSSAAAALCSLCVVAGMAISAYADDAGFRLSHNPACSGNSDCSDACFNNASPPAPGHNLNFLGECGSFTSTDLTSQLNHRPQTDLSGIQILDSKLNGVDLSKINMKESTIIESNLRDTNLQSADLSNSWLRGDDFTNADLSNANLQGSNLSLSDFTKANLSGTNLSNAILDQTILSGASFDTTTQLPISIQDALGRGMTFISDSSHAADIHFNNGNSGILLDFGFPHLIFAAATDGNGRALAAGYYEIQGPDRWNRRTGFVVRLTADGSIASDFGQAGTVRFNTGTSAEFYALGVADDGSIVAAGDIVPPSHSPEQIWLIAKYDKDGHPALSFNGGKGFITDSLLSFRNFIDAVFALHDGSIVVVGNAFEGQQTYHSVVAVKKYTASGVTDTSFGTNGQVIIDDGSSASGHLNGFKTYNKWIIGPDQKLIGVGTVCRDDSCNSRDITVVRLLPSGSFDPSFQSGRLFIPHPGRYVVTTAGIGSDNAIYICLDYYTASGAIPPAEAYRPQLMKVNANGTVDTTFGTNGLVTLPQSSSDPSYSLITSSGGLKITTEGKPIVAGLSVVQDNLQSMVPPGTTYLAATAKRLWLSTLRLNKDGSVDPSYGRQGRTSDQLPYPDWQTIWFGGRSDKDLYWVGQKSLVHLTPR